MRRRGRETSAADYVVRGVLGTLPHFHLPTRAFAGLQLFF
jgi:hypothetical protein